MHAFLTPLGSSAKLRPWHLLTLPEAQEAPGPDSLYVLHFIAPALMSALPCTWRIVPMCPEGSVMFVDGLWEAIPPLAGCAGKVRCQLKPTSPADFPPAPFLTAWAPSHTCIYGVVLEIKPPNSLPASGLVSADAGPAGSRVVGGS